MFFRLTLLTISLLSGCIGFPEIDGLDQDPPPTDGATGQEATGYLKLLPIDLVLASAPQAAKSNPDAQRNTETN
jgi:hypothetical protein